MRLSDRLAPLLGVLVSLYSEYRVKIGPLQEHGIWQAAAGRRERVRDGRAWIAEQEPCLAAEPVGERTCFFERMHTGAHSWQA